MPDAVNLGIANDGERVGGEQTAQIAIALLADTAKLVLTPGSSVRGAPQVLHNSARLAWGSGPKGETPVYTGVDFIITRDGKIAALYVYLDSPPT
jgi:hypothetical protein